MYADGKMFYFNEGSGNFVFFCNEIGILNIYIININLDNNFDKDDPDGGIFACQKMRKKKQNQFLLILLICTIWKS